MIVRGTYRILIYSLALVFLGISCEQNSKKPVESQNPISIEYPETYELANIILALTDYGKTDETEVRKGFDYYDKMQTFFQPVSNHALLDSVNYSREMWESYLSFRTDSYAFAFDEQNQLKRQFEFYTNEGFQPFDEHLDLINDFVRVSNFRTFFKENQDYYDRISKKYKKTQFIREMKDFLDREFGNQYKSNDQYTIVLSPFAFRMNCHRDIDSTTTADFITIPRYVLFDSVAVSREDLATSIHNLFTEMDHGYVNPTTDIHQELVHKNFNPNLWDNGSGYNDEGNFGVFNEYMTWAVYDIFLKEHFPEFAEEIGLYWSYQNDSRGFKFAHLFTQKLLSLYEQKQANEKIIDLYPKLLEWTSGIQNDLSKPEIISTRAIPLENSQKETRIMISFSEKMEKTLNLSTLF
ncbi:MAG: hypothetical protein AAGH46_08150, partial [Bacteroidota bacterium]